MAFRGWCRLLGFFCPYTGYAVGGFYFHRH
nr:MAG TPA: hypothetical protein [Caudoviricetes sp.]